jgi:hypothetical protein
MLLQIATEPVEFDLTSQPRATAQARLGDFRPARAPIKHQRLNRKRGDNELTRPS